MNIELAALGDAREVCTEHLSTTRFNCTDSVPISTGWNFIMIRVTVLEIHLHEPETDQIGL